MNEPDNHSRHIAYYTQRHCSPQWRLFLELIFDELLNNAGQEESSGFWRHIGSRMALEMPIGECATLETLQQSINDRLSELDWGYTNLRADNEKIHICHSACPAPGATQERIEISLLAMSALLEGLYKGWLHQQGGELDVPITCISHRLEHRECTFLYGR